MTAIMKAQIEWIPLSEGAVRPTQGKTLAVRWCPDARSRLTRNELRVLGRWMQMLTIPNLSSVAKAYQKFDGAARMKPLPYYELVVDVMEEPVKFKLLMSSVTPYLVERYSERQGSAAGASDLSS